MSRPRPTLWWLVTNNSRTSSGWFEAATACLMVKIEAFGAVSNRMLKWGVVPMGGINERTEAAARGEVRRRDGLGGTGCRLIEAQTAAGRGTHSRPDSIRVSVGPYPSRPPRRRA